MYAIRNSDFDGCKHSPSAVKGDSSDDYRCGAHGFQGLLLRGGARGGVVLVLRATSARLKFPANR